MSLETLSAPQTVSKEVTSSPVVREISFFVLVLFGFVGMMLMLLLSGCATDATAHPALKTTATALVQPNQLRVDHYGIPAAVVVQ